MGIESPNLRLTVDHGNATLWLGFPGEPANALDLPRLQELSLALKWLSKKRNIRVLVVRSANPAGFCGGLRPEVHAGLAHSTDRAAFAWFGQQVLDQLARLQVVTLAAIEGSCLGTGFELALACDYRFCVARATTHLGFPARHAYFGGSARVKELAGRRGTELLRSGDTISGREARKMGLVDVASCERRANLELQGLLDRLETHLVKPRRRHSESERATERRDFAARPLPRVERPPHFPSINPDAAFPEIVGIWGDDANTTRVATEAVLRGGQVVVCGNRSGIFDGIARALTRGFITPLEAEQARLRVRASDTLEGFDRAGLILVVERENVFRLAAVVQPRAIICAVTSGTTPLPTQPVIPFPYPRRLLRLGFFDVNRAALFPSAATDTDTLATLSAWLRPFGLEAVVFPVAARLLPRAA